MWPATNKNDMSITILHRDQLERSEFEAVRARLGVHDCERALVWQWVEEACRGGYEGKPLDAVTPEDALRFFEDAYWRLEDYAS